MNNRIILVHPIEIHMQEGVSQIEQLSQVSAVVHVQVQVNCIIQEGIIQIYPFSLIPIRRTIVKELTQRFLQLPFIPLATSRHRRIRHAPP